MLAGYAFHRVWSLEVTAPEGSGALSEVEGPVYAGATPAIQFGTPPLSNAILRVSFEVESTSSGESNKAKVNIYNLKPAHRAAIDQGSLVRIRAGYGANYGLLFNGHVAKISSKRNGADVVTSLECGDGEPIIGYAYISKSYKRKVQLAQVLTDIAKQMNVIFGGLTCTIQPGICQRIPNHTYPRGVVLHESCRDALDRLLTPLQMEWNVYLGALNIYPKDAPKVVQAEVLSKFTGLINTPAKTEKAVTCQALLNPNIQPGVLVQLVSDDPALCGYFKVRTAKYTGDSHDSSWSVDCELYEPDDIVTQAVPTAIGLDLTTAVALGAP